ncbi:chaplin family protein [Rhizomonospora bruguierae]|uniref:chaplin family protein n=1 Tax=Rhizomonospora bruguierae TaxID=1581705 RepID=UPI001BCCAD84|nr:chaplin family protein [Micromonospora sp. NBRC 107566]
MKTWVRKSLSVGVLAAGAVLASGGAAMADSSATTSDNYGIGNGAQVQLPIQAPVNLCGNAVAGAGGAAFAECTGGATATGLGGAAQSSSDNYGIGNGAQLYAPIQVPLNVCGNGVAGLGGAAFASCEGGSEAGGGNDGGNNGGGYGEAARAKTEGAAAVRQATSGNFGIGNGVQVYAPIQVPIDACGNSVAGFGAATFAGCEGGATAKGAGSGSVSQVSSDNYGIGNGVQVYAPVQVPVDISGNAVGGAFGIAFAQSKGGASATRSGAGNATESLPVVSGLPVNDLLGGLIGGKARHATEGSRVASQSSGGNFGIGNGVQIQLPIQVPINLSGNAVAGLGGLAKAGSTGGASAR